MKTFLTEKHNIPEGATHYSDEIDAACFAWYKKVDSIPFLWCVGYEEEWVLMIKPSEFDDDIVKPIPQTKEVEWENGLPPIGEECEWIGGGVNHGDWGLVVVHAYSGDYAWIEKLHDNSMHTVKHPAHFRKPETPEVKKEREELEAAYDLYCEWVKEAQCARYSFDQFKDTLVDKFAWLAIVRKTGYRVKK